MLFKKYLLYALTKYIFKYFFIYHHYKQIILKYNFNIVILNNSYLQYLINIHLLISFKVIFLIQKYYLLI